MICHQLFSPVKELGKKIGFHGELSGVCCDGGTRGSLLVDGREERVLSHAAAYVYAGLGYIPVLGLVLNVRRT